jgi:4,5-dihydroxyphthalate decarboxylase
MSRNYSAAFSLSDRSFPLLAGLVGHPDIHLSYQRLGMEEIFHRQIADAAFDIAECTLGSYLMAKDRDERRLTAVPIPLSRRFRQDQIYVAVDSPLHSISDLHGKRFGLPEFQATPAIWLRGMFRELGIPSDQVVWVTYRPERLPITRRSNRGSAKTLTEGLLRGEIDCGFSPTLPPAENFPRYGKTGAIRRLLADPWEADRINFQRTKLFPITTILTLRAEAVEQMPDLAREIYAMFLEAKEEGMKNLRNAGHLIAMEPFLQEAFERSSEVLGPDPWPYGFDACWNEIETFMAFMLEDGLIQRKLRPEEVFHHSTFDT